MFPQATEDQEYSRTSLIFNRSSSSPNKNTDLHLFQKLQKTMDSIKAQKIEAMRSYKRAQFLYNLIVYSITALLSCLFYLYLFWFPSASMNHLFSVLVPNIYSFFVLSPNKLLFLVGNLIVLFLLGESKLGSKQRSSVISPADEIHDEYVRRIKSMRREGSMTNLRRKKSVKNLCAMENYEKVEGAHENKIVEHDVIVVPKVKRVGSSTNLRRKKSVMKNLCAIENYEKIEGAHEKPVVSDVQEEKHDVVQVMEVEKVCNVQEEPNDVVQLVPRADVETDGGEIRAVVENEELGVLLLPRDRDDELKTRAESFIARVNRQMMLEESIW